MATGKSYLSRSKFRFLPPGEGADHRRSTGDAVFDFDESDLFNSAEVRRSVSKTRISKRMSAKVVEGGDRSETVASSLPVNIPDWSKILRKEYTENRRERLEEGDEFEEERSRVPPHEFLARRKIASFSVQEGIGRTLKGRDLSRVRDAIWQKTGFED